MTAKHMSDDDLERVALMLEEEVNAPLQPGGVRDEYRTAVRLVRQLKVNAKVIALPRLMGSRKAARGLVDEAGVTDGDWVKIDFREARTIAPSFMEELIAYITDKGGKII